MTRFHDDDEQGHVWTVSGALVFAVLVGAAMWAGLGWLLWGLL